MVALPHTNNLFPEDNHHRSQRPWQVYAEDPAENFT